MNRRSVDIDAERRFVPKFFTFCKILQQRKFRLGLCLIRRPDKGSRKIQMKLYFILSPVLLFALFASGCQSAAINDNQNAAATAKKQVLKLNDVIKAFKEANLPLGNLDFLSAKSDPQQLLGKPNQYTEKAVWQTNEKIVHTIEAFAVEADLQARKTAIEAAAQPGAQPAEHVYAHKNVLLRLHGAMLPETAARYEQALKSL